MTMEYLRNRERKCDWSIIDEGKSIWNLGWRRKLGEKQIL